MYYIIFVIQKSIVWVAKLHLSSYVFEDTYNYEWVERDQFMLVGCLVLYCNVKESRFPRRLQL